MKRSGGLLAVGLVPGLLAACGGSDDDTSTSGGSSAGTGEVAGTIVMINYPGWMGKDQIANFHKKYPEANVKEVTNVDPGSSALVTQVRQSPGDYDLILAGATTAGHLQRAEALETFDPERVPNLKNMPQEVRDFYTWGIPTDYGRLGIGYRSDLMDEKPTSWSDLWELAPKYSGKITMLDFDTDIIGITLRKLGYSANSTDLGELEEARDALIEVKPHIKAFLATDSTKPLIQGDAVMTATYDYEIANAQKENENIVWVDPEEGTAAYMTGWAPLKGTEVPDAIYAFMDFSLQPKIYADFVNTTGTAYLMPDAEPYIDDSITGNKALAFNLDTITNLEFSQFLDPEAVEAVAKMWREVKAS